MPHYRRRRRRLMAEMNVVPYIDVMLVLLIIFMVTSPMLSLTEGVEVDLPEVAAQSIETADLGPVVITVDKNGGLFISHDEVVDQALPRDRLLARVVALRRDAPARPVLVRGDREVSHGHIVELMALLRNAGVEKVGLVTRPPEDGATP